MAIPEDYNGPSLEFILRTAKPDNTSDVVDQLFSHLKNESDGGKVAIYLKDQPDGEVTEQTLKALSDKGFGKTDMKEFMDKVHMTKIEPELENMGVAGNFVKWTFSNIINEVEDIIDAEKEIKHSQIQTKVERMLEKPETIAKFLSQFPKEQKPDQALLEYPIAVLIQSGANFTVNRFNVQSDQSKLNAETIYVNVCGKYRDMNVMASRTLLVNPEESQKRAYNIAFETLDVCIKNLIVGQPVKNAYIAAKDFIKTKDADFGGKIHTNLGFGVSLIRVFTFMQIGCNIKEDSLIINETNENLVQPNMTFHVRITLADVNAKPSRGIIAIGDTVVIKEEGPQILTLSIHRKYSDISYSLSVRLTPYNINPSLYRTMRTKR